MLSNEKVVYVQTQQYQLQPGTTLAVFINSEPGQVSSRIEYVSGGSLLVFAGATAGATLAAATLVAFGNSLSFCQVLSTVPISFAGPASFYLAATGATCIAQVFQGFSANDGSGQVSGVGSAG